MNLHLPGSRRLPGWRIAALLAILVFLAVWRSSVGTRLDGFTVDEPWHIVAGADYVRNGNRHLNPEHPPLVKLWTGVAMPGDFRIGPSPPLTGKDQERDWVERTVFLDNDPAAAQQRARQAMWALNGILLLLLGWAVWHAGGPAWAIGTVGFIVLEPTLAAHMPVVMTDGPLALTLVPAAVVAGLLAARWRWSAAVVFGLAAGLALSAKHSALAGLGGLALVLAVAMFCRAGSVRELVRRGAMLLVAGLISVAVLWAQYGFRFHANADGEDAFNRPLSEKIAEISSPVLRGSIEIADRLHLLPRAYLWGLADTVRTGVEGRGIAVHLVYGERHHGRAPWFTWPVIVATKMPLALSALSALGLCLLLLRPGLPAAARWMLVALAASSAAHLLALVVSPGSWGGVRHATPLIAAAAVLGGAAVAQAWRRRSHVLLAACAALYVAAFVTTIREPRLWEYHNELVGGSAGAWRYFSNEGLDLGQRFDEVADFYHRRIAPSGQPFYIGSWATEEQLSAAGVEYRKRVADLDDDNVEGIYEGWFLYTNSSRLPMPEFDWNPDEVFEDLVLEAQIGNAGIWRGRQQLPATRASSLGGRVMEYLYKEGGRDDALVAARLEEVAAILPQRVDVGVELGNAYLRMGRRDDAARAWRRLVEQDRAPLDAKVESELRSHLARLDRGDDLATLPPLRNPWME